MNAWWWLERVPVYPVALTMAIVLALGVSSGSRPADVVPLAAVLALCLAGLIAACSALTRRPRIVGALATLLTVATLLGRDLSTVELGLVALLSLVLAAALLRLPAEPLRIATAGLNVMGGLLLVFAATSTVRWQLALWRGDRGVAELPLPALGPASDTPPILHILLDGYGDPQWLQAHFGCGGALVPLLEDRGFTVVPGARSNHAKTLLSTAAMLQMAPIDTWVPPGPNAGPLTAALRHNRVERMLTARGYRTEQVPSEFEPVRLAGTVHRPRPAAGLFDLTLLGISATSAVSRALGLPALRAVHALHMRQQRFALDQIARPLPGSTFRFVHVLAPHPPFVVEPSGVYRPDQSHHTIQDGSDWMTDGRDAAAYRQGYCAKLRWLTPRLIEPLDAQLAAHPDTVVVIHGDHGPGSALDWNAGGDVAERYGALVAVRAPAAVRERLYAGMTLVNVYPVVFEGLFAAAVPRAPDTLYWSMSDAPLAFREITSYNEAAP